MVRKSILLVVALLCLKVQSQEVLLPLQRGPVGRTAVKNAVQPLKLPFYDDFSEERVSPAEQRWQTAGGVALSSGKGLLPPTVGVATLDAIGADGRLYDGASSGLFAADTLCSLFIDLDSLDVSDSVVMSFYYLPGGGKGDLWRRIGDAPERQDSLMLDFYRACDSTWVTVWARGGIEVDSLVAQTGREWQYVAITIKDTAFFNDAFAFRFRNYCSVTESTKPGMTGNCDYWHVDYVVIDRGRTSVGEADFHDVAFVEPAPSMLAAYQAMPARQYRQSDMADSIAVTITNLFHSQLATHYGFAVLDAMGDTLYHYDGGYENAPSHEPDGSYQTAVAHATPSVGYVFPEGEGMTEYSIVHVIREGVGGDDYGWNDTIRFRQVFGSYYAYDDGTAENGYGLTSTASKVYLACRYDLTVADTLTAVDLYFNQTVDGDNETVPFNITVWSNDGGRPGTVLYRDRSARRPVMDGLNVYHRYRLENPVEVSGSVFVGFEQGNNHFINLGFDRSNDVSERIFYLTGTEWQQSILSGSLMMRPCFGIAGTVGIEIGAVEDVEWRLYPNPASEWVRVEGLPTGSVVTLYDMTGVQLKTTRDNVFSVVGLKEGVYLLRCVTPKGFSGTRKLIIKH